MKKIPLSLTLLFIFTWSFAAVTGVECNTIAWSTGCDSCFKEADALYTCNAENDTCNKKEWITLMSDIVTNTAVSWNKVMYDNDEGQIYTYPLQNVTWSKSATKLLDMFQFPENYIQWRKNLTVWPTVAWSDDSDAYIWYQLLPGNSVKWIEFKPNQWLRPDFIGNWTLRTQPALRAEFIPRLYTNATSYVDHKQCIFYYVRWCGDNVLDTDKGEQCDNGTENGKPGNPCSITCENVTTPTLSCNNLTLATSPATLTKNGWTITATCSASNATHYKFILKQGNTEITTKPYQTGREATFTLPENSWTSAKGYSVECLVKNDNQSDKTDDLCKKSLTVPGTVVEPSVCNSLTVTPSTATINTPISFTCNATNATSYIIKIGSVAKGTVPNGTFTFPESGTYEIGCYINGQNTTPTVCKKSVTITPPPLVTIPSIFIDKDDSTPGIPDTDGNDIQKVEKNGTATFTIRVVNNGSEALKNVTIDDPLASDCSRTASQTASLYAGWATVNFDVNETFSYTCTKTNVTSTTFPNNRNTATVKWVWVTTNTNVTDSDISEIFIWQWNPKISIVKDDTDNLDDTQRVDKNGTAKFSVKVTNSGDESLDNLVLTDKKTPDCDRNETETRTLIRGIGNRDSILDPGEKFAYTCKQTGVTSKTFPDGKNTVCVDANGVDSKEKVDACDDTRITLRDQEENSMCLNIESSEGTFGGAPFRTTITCEVEWEAECQIEIMKDWKLINTYYSCSRTVTLSDRWEYSAACIVNDERVPECEMDISVESMTDVPTGTKIILLGLISIALSSSVLYFYKKRAL